MITGINSITVWTENLEPMFRFYHDLLGLPIHSRRTDFIAFQVGQMHFNLYRHDRVHGSSKDPYRVMVHMRIDDIDQIYQRLSTEGVKFDRPPSPMDIGGWLATVQDPDGNVFQMYQPPEGQ